MSQSSEEVNTVKEFVDKYREVLGDVYAIKNLYDLWRDRKPFVDVYHIYDSITPTWTGLHTFDAGATLNDVLTLWNVSRSNFPTSPNTGGLLFGTDRGIPAWWDGDNYEHPTYVDPQDVETSAQTVTNTTDETEIVRFSTHEGGLVEGRVIIMRVFGKYSTSSSSDGFTYRVKLGESGFDAVTGGSVIDEVDTVQENVTDGPWQVKTTMTVFDEGSNGTMSTHNEGAFNNTKRDDHVDPTTIDTTTAEDIVVTIEWDDAEPGNSATRGQAYLQHQA